MPPTLASGFFANTQRQALGRGLIWNKISALSALGWFAVVKIYDPVDDSLIGEFELTVGGWDNWRAKKWERCFMVVREPTPEAIFLLPDSVTAEPLLRMELWVREFDYQQQPKSLYGAPRNIIEYAIAVNGEVTADMQRTRLMTVEDRLLADETYRRLKAKREHMKMLLSNRGE